MTHRFCKDCRHCDQTAAEPAQWRCGVVTQRRSPLTGEVIGPASGADNPFCAVQRAKYEPRWELSSHPRVERCGERGDWWEPKSLELALARLPGAGEVQCTEVSPETTMSRERIA